MRGDAERQPLVSCLCVTEGRGAFMPWLLWGFQRQTWVNRELVIVDSSPDPFVSGVEGVRVIAAPPGTNVPTKRNTALAAAEGDMIAWFDDDDWQHPERLSILVRAVLDGADYAGCSRSWFVDLHEERCRPYDGRGAMIFNSAVFRRATAAKVRFDEKCRKASDTPWMRALSEAGTGRLVSQESLSIWLSHETNISNPRSKRGFFSDLSALRRHLAENGEKDPWGDTESRLAALRKGLPAPQLLDRSGGRLRQTAPRAGELASTAARVRRRPRPASIKGLVPPVGKDAEGWKATSDSQLAPDSSRDSAVVPLPPRAVAPRVAVLRLLEEGGLPNRTALAHLAAQTEGPSSAHALYGGEAPGWQSLHDGSALSHWLEGVDEEFVLCAFQDEVFAGTPGQWVRLAQAMLRRRETSKVIRTHAPGGPHPSASHPSKGSLLVRRSDLLEHAKTTQPSGRDEAFSARIERVLDEWLQTREPLFVRHRGTWSVPVLGASAEEFEDVAERVRSGRLPTTLRCCNRIDLSDPRMRRLFLSSKWESEGSLPKMRVS